MPQRSGAGQKPYDAILILSFGGPEQPADVIPFLENVLRGRNVPRARMLEVAEHYYHFGGKSPINSQMRELIAALQAELAARGPRLPVYWGNRNWHPLVTDALREMQATGVRRAVAFVMSAYSSYSGCRLYLEDIVRAREAVGSEGVLQNAVPEIDKLRVFYNHPGFIEAVAGSLRHEVRTLAMTAGGVGVVAGLLFIVNPETHFFPSVAPVIAWLLLRSLILAVSTTESTGSVRMWTGISATVDVLLAILLITGLSVSTLVISVFGPTPEMVASFAWVVAASFIANGLLLLEVASCEARSSP